MSAKGTVGMPLSLNFIHTCNYSTSFWSNSFICRTMKLPLLWAISSILHTRLTFFLTAEEQISPARPWKTCVEKYLSIFTTVERTDSIFHPVPGLSAIGLVVVRPLAQPPLPLLPEDVTLDPPPPSILEPPLVPLEPVLRIPLHLRAPVPNCPAPTCPPLVTTLFNLLREISLCGQILTTVF